MSVQSPELSVALAHPEPLGPSLELYAIFPIPSHEVTIPKLDGLIDPPLNGAHKYGLAGDFEPKPTPDIVIDCPSEADDGAEDIVGAVQPLTGNKPHNAVTQIEKIIRFMFKISSDLLSKLFTINLA
jgi:hypothetical protein